MAEISVRVAGDDVYEVTPSAQDVLEESFRFMLAREPKEAIHGRFDLRTIARYFPEYPSEMRRRIGS